jgi:hypothetical protein
MFDLPAASGSRPISHSGLLGQPPLPGRPAPADPTGGGRQRLRLDRPLDHLGDLQEALEEVGCEDDIGTALQRLAPFGNMRCSCSLHDTGRNYQV